MISLPNHLRPSSGNNSRLTFGMNKRLSIFFVTLLVCLWGLPAHAQLFKRLFGKDDPKPVHRTAAPHTSPTRPTKTVAEPVKATKGPEILKLGKSILKNKYRIDVLAFVYLNELVANGKPIYKSHLPNKVLPGLGFYQGVKLAADSLNRMGYHLDVYFHDIGDPSKSLDLLLKQGELDSTDLIIGAVAANQVAPLAALAKKHEINFVSSVSPSDGNVKANFYFNLLIPSIHVHCERIRAALSTKSSFSNILVYQRSSNGLDESCFKEITKDSSFPYTRINMNALMPAEKLRNFLDSNSTNTIVMPIVDVVFAGQLLDQLSKSFPKFRFEIYGMPTWKGMAVLQKVDALPNLGINIGAPFYFDPSTSAGKNFSDDFNTIYGGKPSEMAYRGYETLYWYGYLLNHYGTIFNEHFQDNGMAPFTRFDLKLEHEKNTAPMYYENRHVCMYHYQSGSFTVMQ